MVAKQSKLICAWLFYCGGAFFRGGDRSQQVDESIAPQTCYGQTSEGKNVMLIILAIDLNGEDSLLLPTATQTDCLRH